MNELWRWAIDGALAVVVMLQGWRLKKSKTRFVDSKTEKTNVETLEEVREFLRAELSAVREDSRREIERLDKAHDECEGKHADLEARVSALKKQNAEQESQIESLKRHVARLEAERKPQGGA